MRRRTMRFPAEQLKEVRTQAARHGITEAHYIRSAIDRQLGRDSCLDEIAAAEQRALERDAVLERKLIDMNQRVARVERRVAAR